MDMGILFVWMQLLQAVLVSNPGLCNPQFSGTKLQTCLELKPLAGSNVNAFQWLPLDDDEDDESLTFAEFKQV